MSAQTSALDEMTINSSYGKQKYVTELDNHSPSLFQRFTILTTEQYFLTSSWLFLAVVWAH